MRSIKKTIILFDSHTNVYKTSSRLKKNICMLFNFRVRFNSRRVNLIFLFNNDV